MWLSIRSCRGFLWPSVYCPAEDLYHGVNTAPSYCLILIHKLFDGVISITGVTKRIMMKFDAVIKLYIFFPKNNRISLISRLLRLLFLDSLSELFHPTQRL